MQAVIIIDAQNEFSAKGQRPVPNHEKHIAAIRKLVTHARENKIPIAWVKHFNKPDESPAFVPGSWGAEFFEGFGPAANSETEKIFEKNVYGAFTGSNLGEWLASFNVSEVIFGGFYTHGCLSTTAREAIMKDYSVIVLYDATGACDLEDKLLGRLSAEEVRRSALIHLAGMGATIRASI